MIAGRGLRTARTIAAAAVYLFLVLPMMVVVLFSFSDRSYFTFPPTGFSLLHLKSCGPSCVVGARPSPQRL